MSKTLSKALSETMPSEAVFRVVKAGPLTLFQDAGRPGFRRYGVPVSGAMDQFAYRAANWLVGNAEGAVTLEVLLHGLTLDALRAATVAVTGADLGLEVDGQAAPCWRTLRVAAGARLRFAGRRSGCRAYLAVGGGGFEAPRYLGSASTFVKGRMGSAVRTGDVLFAGAEVGEVSRDRVVREENRPVLEQPQRVRVILGPQDGCFSRRGIQTFLESPYRISAHSDRQGFRTEGPAIEIVRGPGIISDPTPLGAVQVPGDGRPIVLQRDGQVTGGYAKIAKVAAADLDWFGRLMPGEEIRFEAVTREEAMDLAREYRMRLEAFCLAANERK